MNKMQSPPKGKKEQMRRMFDRIAAHYDSLNYIMSFNIDRSWRRRGWRWWLKADRNASSTCPLRFAPFIGRKRWCR